MLKLEFCRIRQERLLRHMERQGLDRVALANPKTIHYFTGSLVDATLPQAFVIRSSGDSLLVTNAEPSQTAAGRVELYTGYTIRRIFNRRTMWEEAADAVRGFAAGNAATVALDFEFAPAALVALFSGRPIRNITPALDEMRRRKDPDELDSIRATIALTEAGYAAIKARLEPGMTEYQAQTVIYEAVCHVAETSVDLRGDFACGTRGINGGGPPTNRKVLAGDLYIFDLFPIHEGYMCDLCRTFAAGPPSQLQQNAWAHISQALGMAEGLIRPGVRGCDVYEEIRAHLDNFEPARGSFNHHLGHGLGMDGWEFPWLTPGSDQVIQEGEVIAIEPGLYSEAMQGGIRLEHNYLVGKNGVTALDSFPLELR